jgi:hypothetical protein
MEEGKFYVIPESVAENLKLPRIFKVYDYLHKLISNNSGTDANFFWGSSEYLSNIFKVSIKSIQRDLVVLEKNGLITRVEARCEGVNGTLRRIYLGKLNKLVVDVIKQEMITQKSDLPKSIIKPILLSDFINDHINKMTDANLKFYLINYVLGGFNRIEIKPVMHWLNICNKAIIDNYKTKTNESGKSIITISSILQSFKIN